MTNEEILTKLKDLICPEVTLIFNDEDDSYFEYCADIISMDAHPKDDDGFLRHLLTKHKCEFAYTYPLALWTLLHEIGHYFTLDDVSDTDRDLETRILCATIPIEVAQNNEYIQNLYYNLESEWLATEWAIGYVYTNRGTCDRVAQLLD